VLIPTIADSLDIANEALADALDLTRKLSDDQTWQVRAETDEIEVLHYRERLLRVSAEIRSLARIARGKTRDLDKT
jgi:hypothetical protein